MDVIAELKRRQCDPGPVHSPRDECPCEMEQPCSCVVDGAAIDEIMRLRAELADLNEGRRVVLPKNKQHAGVMHLLAERWLSDNPN